MVDYAGQLFVNTYANSSATTLTAPVTTWTTSYTPVFPPAPRKPTNLEWLDAEVEKTCALAR